MRLRSEIVFPRASAIGYHRFYVIRQSAETVRRELTDVRFRMNHAEEKWRNVTRRAFVTFAQMLFGAFVLGHVLLRGHARYRAAYQVESRGRPNDLKQTQALPMSSFLPLFLYSLVNQVERVGPTIA